MAQVKKLKDFCYGFNEEGKLKKLDKETGQPTDEGFDFNVSKDHMINQKNYEELGESITDFVYELMEKNDMHKISIPCDIPKEEATFIFSSQEKLDKPRKLMILIHGSGVVRAGQWARSLIINQSIDHGTVLPYIKKGRELGYDVLITNGNDNYRVVNGKNKSIPGSDSPISHGKYVFEKYVIPSNPESIAIVAHSYGGVVTMELARSFPDFFRKKVFGIGFTDSVHSMPREGQLTEFLNGIGRNFVTSSKSLDVKLSSDSRDIPRYSAGHTKHEWTSYACMSALFQFLEHKYLEFSSDVSVKKPKLND